MKSFKVFFSLILALLITSCSTSSDVASNRGIQKRKYNNGYYVSFKKNNRGKTDKKVQTEVIDQEIVNVIQEGKTNPKSASSNEKINFDESVTYADHNEVVAENDFIENSKEGRRKRGGLFPKMIKKNNLSQPEKSGNKTETEESKGSSGGDMFILLVILCFFIPWLSVGLYTDWDVLKTVIALLLWFLFWLPGVIYGLLVLFDVI